VPLLLVLPHELGHALAALAFGVRPVDVYVGAEPRFRLSLGALHVHVRPLNGWRWMWYGTVDAEGSVPSRWRRASILAAGPLTTVLLVLAYSAAAAAAGGLLGWFFWFLAFGGVWEFAVTALPIRYGRLFGPYAGRVSDGYRIREALGGS
jgi:Zn-dependent protease